MARHTDEQVREAESAQGERLWELVRMRSPRVAARAAMNRHLTEDMAVFIARGRNVPSEVLGMLAGDVRFKKSYPLQLTLCANPKTPLRVAMSLLKFIKLFDLADISRDHNVSSVMRQRVEQMLYERIPTMPAGVKIALARRASNNVILRIMERSERRVVDSCLDSPRLTEEQLMSLVYRETVKPPFLRALAEHPKWSVRYRLRFSLIRHPMAPLSVVEAFLPEMRVNDLKEMYADPEVPAAVKPFIHSELVRREVVPSREPEPEEVFEMAEDEDHGLRGELTNPFSDAGPPSEPDIVPEDDDAEPSPPSEGD